MIAKLSGMNSTNWSSKN